MKRLLPLIAAIAALAAPASAGAALMGPELNLDPGETRACPMKVAWQVCEWPEPERHDEINAEYVTLEGNLLRWAILPYTVLRCECAAAHVNGFYVSVHTGPLFQRNPAIVFLRGLASDARSELVPLPPPGSTEVVSVEFVDNPEYPGVKPYLYYSGGGGSIEVTASAAPLRAARVKRR